MSSPQQMLSQNAGLADYDHTRLEDPSRQIRLVHVLPGHTSSICIKLTDVEFSDSRELNYEALSYAWGSGEKPEMVTVVGDSLTKMQIRANLHLALQALRLDADARVLWVDAICINQEDLTERSKQLVLMHSIYKSATQVIAWIGPPAADSDCAIDCIKTITSHVAIDIPTLEFRSLSGDSQWSNTSKLLPLTDLQITAIANLLRRPWFERLWIWPEIRLGSERAKVRCGERELAWNDLRTAVVYLESKPMAPSDATTRLLSRLAQMIFLCAAPQLPFFTALHRSRWCKCSDARDHLFTALVLDSNTDIPGIEPSYEESVEDVYINLTIAWMNYYRTLEFLNYAEGRSRLSSLPSWVPDWSTEAPAYRLQCFCASAMSKSYARYDGTGTLSVKGLVVSEILRTVPFQLTNSGFIAGDLLDYELAGHLRRVLDGIDLSVDFEQLRALCRVFAQDRFSETQIEPDRIPFTQDTSQPSDQTFSTRVKKENYLRAILGLKQTVNLPLDEFRAIRRSLRTSYSDRSTFTALSGRYGVAPLEARPGDFIVVILGCDSPMILRQRADGAFQLVGEAYFDGSMYGEALLGPLPPHVNCVRRYDSENNFVWAFQDQRTRDLSPYDPRLPDLPLEWDLVEDKEEEVAHFFRNKLTGDVCTRWADPRCTAEAFEGRGVVLREFHLR